MKLQSHDLVLVFLGLSVLLLLAKLFGGVARRLGQAAVLGELIAGIFLGPTVLGWLAPDIFFQLFPKTTPGAAFFSGFQQVSVVFFILVAGMEIQLKRVVSHVRVALPVSVAGVVVPFAIGLVAAKFMGPEGVAGVNALTNPLVFELFFATEWMGVHALFGAFLAGVTLGDSDHFDERAREPLDQFVMSVLAPIFFATIGLRVDFVKHFDFNLVGVVFIVATIGKVLGCAGAARLGGMPWNRAWAVGFAMNARGAMEIVLGLLALDAGLISERLFVALVIMALVTSLLSAPLLRYFVKRPLGGVADLH